MQASSSAGAIKRCQVARVLRCNLRNVGKRSLEDLRPLRALCHGPGLASLQELHTICLAHAWISMWLRRLVVRNG